MRVVVREATEHFAICGLARIDGTSPVDYLPEEQKRETVRNLCRQVLVRLTPRGNALLEKLAHAHRAELLKLGPKMGMLLQALDHANLTSEPGK